MSDTLVIRTADIDDISTIGYLAHAIWPKAYHEILSTPQLDYMLQIFYSPDALAHQITTLNHQFIIAEIDLEAVGFASYSAVAGATWKLHKLYVLPGLQGKGVGRALVDMVEEEVRTHNGAHLILNMNKKNNAIRFYTSLGFVVEKEEIIDIGKGYLMDDFVLGKNV